MITPVDKVDFWSEFRRSLALRNRDMVSLLAQSLYCFQSSINMYLMVAEFPDVG